MAKTEDMGVGDILDCGDRRVVVVDNQPSGLGVIWYSPEGLGPFYGVLPHAGTYQRTYENEQHTRESYWKTHPDFTGKTGEV